LTPGVEIRLPSSRCYGGARRAALDEYRLCRVAAAAQAIAQRFGRAGEDRRIDVLLLAPGRFPRHIVNAWMG
jgi:putative endonuclease